MKTLEEILSFREDIIGDKPRNRPIESDDCIFLYNFMKTHPAQKVIEIGTWYGVSTMVMAECGSSVWTCDKNKELVYAGEEVYYYNMWSTKFLKKMAKQEMQFDMAFLDGRLLDCDIKRFVKLLKPGSYIVTHDYFDNQKGVRNFKLLKKWIGDIQVVNKIGITRRK